MEKGLIRQKWHQRNLADCERRQFQKVPKVLFQKDVKVRIIWQQKLRRQMATFGLTEK